MNKFYYTKSQMCGVIEHAVTLETGTDVYTEKDVFVQGLVKTRFFDTQETALTFFKEVVRLFKHLPPFQALYMFNTFGIRRKNVLSHVVRENEQIMHRIVFPEGYSCWHAKLQGNLILRDNGAVYKSLTAFASAHYKEVHPTRKTANGWKECRVRVKHSPCWSQHFGWMSLAVLREIRDS